MKIGIFGGTFDPPHFGHLILAAEALDQLKLDRLLFVLTADPPHKQGRHMTAIEDRLALLKAALVDNPAFELSRVDIDRPGPHYTVDTVQLLREQHPGAELTYLMGGDSMRNLLIDWHKPDEFVEACDFIGVMRRPQDYIDVEVLEAQIPGLKNKVLFMDAPLLEISSHQIRERAASGRPYRYYLPRAVYDIICQHRLYQTSDCVN